MKTTIPKRKKRTSILLYSLLNMQRKVYLTDLEILGQYRGLKSRINRKHSSLKIAETVFYQIQLFSLNFLIFLSPRSTDFQG